METSLPLASVSIESKMTGFMYKSAIHRACHSLALQVRMPASYRPPF